MGQEPPAKGLYYIVRADQPGPRGSANRYAGLVLTPQVDMDGNYVVGRANTERKKIPGNTKPLLQYLRTNDYMLWMNASDVRERRPSLIHPNSILGQE